MMGGDPSMTGAPPADPSTPDGAVALMAPLIAAGQAKVSAVKMQIAQSMAAAMAQAMQNIENPAGEAAATLPGVPTAPGSDPGGPDPNAAAGAQAY